MQTPPFPPSRRDLTTAGLWFWVICTRRPLAKTTHTFWRLWPSRFRSTSFWWVDAGREVPPGYLAAVAQGLSAIAPTYYVTGNHEWAVGHVPEMKEALTENGVHVLSNQSLPLTRNGDQIILAGIDGPNAYADQKTPEAVAAEVAEDCGDPFWILLAHRNNAFAEHYSLLGADLVVSGHGHGGLVRLPFTDGLVSTEHTFFPSYTAGLYEKNGSTLFVTRGLGNSGFTFRLFNRPEVAVLTLHKG